LRRDDRDDAMKHGVESLSWRPSAISRIPGWQLARDKLQHGHRKRKHVGPRVCALRDLELLGRRVSAVQWRVDERAR
jgi:hypothetical protein